MVMSTSAQYLPRQGLSLSTVLRPAAATALHAATGKATGETTDRGSPDDTVTIIIAIIGALLTLVSVIVALLQYRLQVHRSRDEERGGDVIAMEPQPPARLARPTQVPALPTACSESLFRRRNPLILLSSLTGHPSASDTRANTF
jgi:hypothetical protein